MTKLRTGLRALAVVLGCLSLVGPARGGLYLPAEPMLVPTNNTQLFLNVLNELRGLRNAENPVRKHFLARVAELEAKQHRGALSVEDRVNISGYYLRLEQFEKAVAILDPIAADPRQSNFMVLSNLATANEQAGRLDRAIGYVELALKNWPDIWPGLNRFELYSLGRVEKHHLELLKLRYLEAMRQPTRGAIPEQPDALFPRVTFENKGGTFRPGELDMTQWIELSSDSPQIVQQLLLWSPNDLRLHWLYAELLNAVGGPDNIIVAYSILDRLASRETPPYRNKLIPAHRQILEDAYKAIVQMNLAQIGDREPNAWLQLLWYAQPRGTTLEPGAAALTSEASWAVRAALSKRLRSAGAPAPIESAPASAEPTRSAGNWLPDTRHVAAVSFAAGVLVTLLGFLQVREFRRRHHSTPAAPKSEA